MKKSIMTLLFVVGMIAVSLAQELTFNEWVTVEVTDEFGDAIPGKSVKLLFLNGSFSNSATVNSELIMKIKDFGEVATIEVYEYNRSPTDMVDNYYCKIAIKAPVGDVIKIKGRNSGGGVRFEGKGYNKLMSSLVRGCKIRIDESDCKSFGSSKWLATWEEY